MPDESPDAWPEFTTEQAADHLPPSVLPTAAVPPELLALSQYTDVRLLGRGGMGAVYVATNKLMDRPEVLKVIGRDLLGKPEAADRFLREMRSAAKLSHPNVVTAYTALPAGDLLVFAMEYVPGENLADVVKNGGPLAVATACYYVYQAALGLQHAHEKGMVHRDIKPGNLMLHKDGRRRTVKVLDFGLAKATSEKDAAGLTATGQVLGTPDYMAPEQTEDAGRADIRADVYALGCTLFYLLTGTAPFKAKSLLDLMLAHREAVAPRLEGFRPDVPAGLQAVLDRLLAKRPADRIPTPAEAARALLPFVKREATTSRPAVPPPAATVVLKPAVPDELAKLVPADAPRPPVPPKKPGGVRWRGRAVGVAVVLVVGVGLWASGLLKPTGRPNADGFVPLFNGKNLDGWRTSADDSSAWSVSLDCTLVGTGPSGDRRVYLVSEKTFTNFHLRFRGRVTPGGIAAVMFGRDRPPSREEEGVAETLNFEADLGGTGKTSLGGVIGPEVRAEAGRTPPPAGEWFDYELIATDGWVTVRVNGATTAQVRVAARRPAGPLTFSLFRTDARVEVRDLEIRELPATVSLFDGTTLAGWEREEPTENVWSLDYGAIAGRSPKLQWSSVGYLHSARDYADFTVRFEFKLATNSRGGVVVRGVPGERTSDGTTVYWPAHPGISLATSTSFGVTTGSNTWLKDGYRHSVPDTPVTIPPNEWHAAEVTVRGDRCTLTVNGKPVIDIRLDPDESRYRGYVPGLKRKAGRVGFESVAGEVWFRNVDLVELK